MEWSAVNSDAVGLPPAPDAVVPEPPPAPESTPESELAASMVEAAKYDRELLVEEFIAGRELTIGILGDQALPILEIIPKGGFYDFTNKYPFLNPQAGGGAEHVCPARIDSNTVPRTSRLAGAFGLL